MSYSCTTDQLTDRLTDRPTNKQPPLFIAVPFYTLQVVGSEAGRPARDGFPASPPTKSESRAPLNW